MTTKRKIRQYISERTLEFLRTHEGRMAVDGPARAEQTFIAEYLKATGCSEPRFGIDIAEGRRWYSATITFKATPLEAATLLVDWKQVSPGSYAIYSNDFFWALVEKGWRLEEAA